MTKTIGWLIFVLGFISFWVGVYNFETWLLMDWLVVGILMITGAILVK